MGQNKSAFDADELMQLALRATERDRVEDGIDYLKQLLEIEPDHAQAIYLLGALHAEIGLFERAAEEIARALELQPNMPTAHLQLGLLHIRSGHIDKAIEAWEPLVSRDENDPIFLFRRGLVNFAEGRISECVLDLEKGIALNTDNEPLNRDMTSVKLEAEKLLEEEAAIRSGLGDSQKPDEAEPGVAPSAHHALLSRYGTKPDD
jgi:tetratricopeptide (TPR) repeat protein